jgi:peptidoglycan L-alanyl-D-glutamate endopeptidase CwlK
MTFKLSQRSLDRLEGVDERLVSVVKSAIGHTKVDFGVICGLRTIGEQRELVKRGASKTMKSKHIEGLAVDLMAYVGSRASWEISLYDEIADAMKRGAKDVGVSVCWGGAWSAEGHAYPFDITKWDGTMEQAYNSYVDTRRALGKTPFIDGPHFQIIV